MNILAAPYFKKYLDLVQGKSIQVALIDSQQALLATLVGLSEEQWATRYEAQKWSIKEVLQHIIDTERIFAYRALRIARADKSPLLGYDDVAYNEAAEADYKAPKALMDEFNTTRLASISLYASFRPTELDRTGVANNFEISVAATGLISAGHTLHHLNLIKTRYLKH